MSEGWGGRGIGFLNSNLGEVKVGDRGQEYGIFYLFFK